MKIFKKILKGAAIGISVLLLIFVGILIYRDATSYKNVIHQDADAVVKIRVDAIGRSIAWDALKNPSYYYEKQKQNDTIDDIDEKGNGYLLPANIFLYTIKGKSVSTIFTSFKIANSKDFKNYLSSNFDIKDSYHIETIQVAKNEDGKIITAYTEDQCVLVYNPKNESVDAIFKDILITNKTLSDSNEFLKKLKDAVSHISFVTTDDEISIDFRKGLASIRGQIVYSKNFSDPQQTKYPKFSEDSSLKFYMNGMTAKLNERINFKNIEFEPDSIFKYYKGNISLEIAGTTTQLDTVITYEYNDDFEKIAIKSRSKSKVPEITVQVAADATKMLDYLEKASIVENGRINKDLFPLYQIKIDSTVFGLEGSTNLNKPVSSAFVLQGDVFGLNINFEKLQARDQFPILNSYFEKLIKLNVKGSKVNDRMIQIQGELQLKDQEILAISQFL